MAHESFTALTPVFLLGLSLGLTACAATCLPFIGTYVLGKAEGRRSGMIDAGLFLSGRMIAYTALGALAGGFGAWFVKHLADGYGNLVIGIASLLSAVLLLDRSTTSHAACGTLQSKALSPLLMGVALTLIPCAPLATLLASAAAGNSLAHGALMGLVFGMGTLLTPMLVLIPATASLAERLRIDQPWVAALLRHLAAGVLVMIGLRRIAAVDESLAALALATVITGWAALAFMQRTRVRRKYAQQIPIVRQPGTPSAFQPPLE